MLEVAALFFFVTICLVTDLVERKIYNSVVLFGLLAAFVGNIFAHGLYLGATYTLSGFFTGIFLLVIPFMMGGLGAGDVKMLGMVGAFVGHGAVVHVFLASALAGGVFALVVMLKEGGFLKRMKKLLISMCCFAFTRRTIYLDNLQDANVAGKAIPFGVALSVGVIIVYVMGSLNNLMSGMSALPF